MENGKWKILNGKCAVYARMPGNFFLLSNRIRDAWQLNVNPSKRDILSFRLKKSSNKHPPHPFYPCIKPSLLRVANQNGGTKVSGVYRANLSQAGLLSRISVNDRDAPLGTERVRGT
jgi:hypothetical protein